MAADVRKYPVGIQDFEKIRKDGYVYVDKTEQIYKMITQGCPYFLSRPRRFGKSLLVSTLQAVFEGKRELFEQMTLDNGTVQPRLFIATTDWKWDRHPVVRFDFSKCEEYTAEGLKSQINNRNEHHYHALLYTLLTAFGADVSAEESTAQGRSDIVLRMPKAIYILEIKYDQTADTALRQIAARGYADKYRMDSRPVIPVALCFSSEARNIVEWKVGE